MAQIIISIEEGLLAKAESKLAKSNISVETFLTRKLIEMLKEPIDREPDKYLKDAPIHDPIGVLIKNRLAWDSDKARWEMLTAAEVLTILGIGNPTQSQKTRASRFIFMLNGGHKYKTNGYVRLLCPAPRVLKTSTAL